MDDATETLEIMDTAHAEPSRQLEQLPALPPEIQELVLGSGDLAKLSAQQRVAYYMHVCLSIGLNPATRPFRFFSLNGQTVLYATRDATDQLRKLHRIDMVVTAREVVEDLYVVTVRAQTPDGRHDEDIGAVGLGQLRGEAKANALMKAMTKAKRRVTLSICGLGFADETEVETLPAATFDHDAEVIPPPPVLPKPAPAAGNGQAPLSPWPQWFKDMARYLDFQKTSDALLAAVNDPKVIDRLNRATGENLMQINAMVANARIKAREMAEREAINDGVPFSPT